MTQRMKCTFLILGLAALATGPAFPQSAPEEVSEPTVLTESSATVAHVYVQTTNGINVYTASSAGKLTLVKGSPFQPSGPSQTMVGSNGKYFIMLGPNDLHSYPVSSSGAIGKQITQINTQSYGGAECDAPAFASEFARGKDSVYVLMTDLGSADCNAIQTYAVNKSGHFVFSGDTTVGTGFNFWIGLPLVTGNGKFSYGAAFCGYDECSCDSGLNLYRPESLNVLEYSSVAAIGQLPPTPPGYSLWLLNLGNMASTTPPALASDPSGHVALSMYATTDADCTDDVTTSPSQLASFTADSNGTLTTTNTYEDMPIAAAGPYILSISPSGKVLAAAEGTGIQFFHFNGANPITGFTGIIGSSGYITAMQWDKNDHLYAINGASGRVHVYTVTTTSVVEAAGSPYSIGAMGLFVAVP